MSCRMSPNQHPSQRANRKANASGHAAFPRIQTMGLSPALDPLDRPQNFVCGNPVAPRCGRVSSHENHLCSFLVNHKAVECKSSINFIEYEPTALDISWLQRANPYGFAVAEGRVHAGTVGLKSHRGPLTQELCNDVLVSGHEGTIPYLKGVGKT
jgi:hypothetical protein